jgi:hypothetical protein
MIPHVVFQAKIRKQDGLWHLDEIGVTGGELDGYEWPGSLYVKDFCNDLERHVDDGPLFFRPWDPVLEDLLETWRPDRYKLYKKHDGDPIAHFRAFKKLFGPHSRDEKRSKRKRQRNKSPGMAT